MDQPKPRPDAPGPAAPATGLLRRRALTVLLVLQVLCIAFFVLDVTADILDWDGVLAMMGHHTAEVIAVGVLAVSTAATVVDLRRMRARHRRMEAQLRAASGAFIGLMEEYFDDWSLTPSERDVALLMVKGLPIAEIAALRNTRDGTVKAQCNAIYSKAGVSGRQQLLSLFIEELMTDRLVPPRAAAQKP